MINYQIGRRTRFRENLIGQGYKPYGEHLSSTIVPAPDRVAEALRIARGAEVHRIMRRGLADDMPINLGIAFHPVALFPDLGARREAGVSVTEIYRDHGVTDYFRKSTTIFTRRAEPEESRLLRQHPDHPVMIVTKIDVDAKGTALGYSEAVWAGDRVQFSFDSLDDPFVGEEGKTP